PREIAIDEAGADGEVRHDLAFHAEESFAQVLPLDARVRQAVEAAEDLAAALLRGPVVAGDLRGFDVGNERDWVEVVDRGLAFRAVRADDQVHRDLLVEVAERAENLGLAVLRRVPAEADARGPAPGEVDLLRAVARVHLLVVIAQAEADREARRE